MRLNSKEYLRYMREGLTVSQAAEELGLAEGTVRQAVLQGRIKSRRVDVRVVLPEDLKAYRKEREVSAVTEVQVDLLRMKRLGARLSQGALAAACGTSTNTINRIERGYQVPRSRLQKKIAQTLDVRMQELFPSVHQE